MQNIDNYDFSGKRAIVRVDFNVPLNESFQITDDTRIRAAIPTLKKVLAGGGSLIVMSHLGRPKGPTDKYSLKHIIPAIEEKLSVKVQFAPDCMGVEAEELSKNLKPGEVLLLENLRFYAEEEGKPRGLAEDVTEEVKKAAKAEMKEKQKEFAKRFASYADFYVNDAFGTAHRAHGSTAVIAEFFAEENKMFGYLINSELIAMDKVLKDAQAPFTAIMGGAKVSDKILIIENLLDRVQNLIIGGGMTYTFIKAQGGEIGNSLCEADKLDLALEILEKAKAKGVNVYIPTDAVNADKFAADAETCVSKTDETPAGWMGLDIGPKSVELFRKTLAGAKTVVWNGPMGVFEMEPFAKGTIAVCEALAGLEGANTIIGGGDSAAAVMQLGYADKVSHISTGGGASLELIEGKVLPGVKALVIEDEN